MSTRRLLALLGIGAALSGCEPKVEVLPEPSGPSLQCRGGGGDCDGDGYLPSEGDCDDYDPDRNPGSHEECDGSIDDNCDSRIDEGCTA